MDLNEEEGVSVAAETSRNQIQRIVNPCFLTFKIRLSHIDFVEGHSMTISAKSFCIMINSFR